MTKTSHQPGAPLRVRSTLAGLPAQPRGRHCPASVSSAEAQYHARLLYRARTASPYDGGILDHLLFEVPAGRQITPSQFDVVLAVALGALTRRALARVLEATEEQIRDDLRALMATRPRLLRRSAKSGEEPTFRLSHAASGLVKEIGELYERGTDLGIIGPNRRFLSLSSEELAAITPAVIENDARRIARILRLGEAAAERNRGRDEITLPREHFREILLLAASRCDLYGIVLRSAQIREAPATKRSDKTASRAQHAHH